MLRKATYVTEWDDGETILESPCTINLLTHEITDIGERTIVESPYTPDTIDDAIENLYAEYVRYGNKKYSVVDIDEEFSPNDYDGIMPFYRRY